MRKFLAGRIAIEELGVRQVGIVFEWLGKGSSLSAYGGLYITLWKWMIRIGPKTPEDWYG